MSFRVGLIKVQSNEHSWVRKMAATADPAIYWVQDYVWLILQNHKRVED
jgi:hypothetical protein